MTKFRLNSDKKIILKNFYSNMDWWSVSDQPASFELIPKAFQKSHSLWKSSYSSNRLEIIKLLSPYIKSLFLINNISSCDNLFSTKKYSEILAYKTNLIDVDFCDSPIPRCKTEAYYLIPVFEDFDLIDLEKWQQENSLFTDAISFYWDIDVEGLDTTYGSHAGIECIPITESI
jgi:hypothetical protein